MDTIKLQVGQFQYTARIIAVQHLIITIVDTQPYLFTGDCASLLKVTNRTIREHLDNIYQEDAIAAKGRFSLPPLQAYQITVFCQSVSDTGRGGGTQWMTIHPLRAFLMAARRSRNAASQAAVLDEVDAIYLAQ